MADVMDAGPGITIIDTLLGGHTGMTAAYLVEGDGPTLIETGSQTSADVVIRALREFGIGPNDLRQIVLTHIHLDHCGGVGDVAAAFPSASVVVHRRGAKHLAEPARLLESSFAVYGDLAPLYGGLTPVPKERIVAVEEGARIDLGGGRFFDVIDAPGHARHQMALVDTDHGRIFTGDALGVRFPGSEIYPTVPPPDFDIDMALTTLARIDERKATKLLLPHFGPIDDPETAIEVAGERQRILSEAALEGWKQSGEAGVAAEVDRRLPMEAVITDEPGRARWRAVLWADNNPPGLVEWIKLREARSNEPKG